MEFINDNLIKKNNSAQSGFTIIEISIVIAIIGVLLAMAFGGLRFLERTRARNTVTKLSAINQALEEYRTNFGNYPTELRQLVEAPTDPKLRRKWQGALATEQELQDAWGKDFEYELRKKGSRPPYELYTINPQGDRINSPGTRED